MRSTALLLLCLTACGEAVEPVQLEAPEVRITPSPEARAAMSLRCTAEGLDFLAASDVDCAALAADAARARRMMDEAGLLFPQGLPVYLYQADAMMIRGERYDGWYSADGGHETVELSRYVGLLLHELLHAAHTRAGIYSFNHEGWDSNGFNELWTAYYEQTPRL